MSQSRGRVSRRIQTSTLWFRTNLYGPHSEFWYLSHAHRTIDGVWTQGQFYLDENRKPRFFWHEEYQVNMREIWEDRLQRRIELMRELAKPTSPIMTT